MNNVIFVSDLPIQSSSADKFGRCQFAYRIADVILNRVDKSSIVIGINAPWGEGKTSVLNMISERLGEKKALIIDFNPWRYPCEDVLLRSFYSQLADKLGIRIEKVTEKVGRFFSKFAPFAGSAKVPGIDMEKVASGVANLISEAKVEKLKKRVVEALEKKKKRVVILMDDIDRLDADEIQSVFRLIKLSASFPYTAYVISLDESCVAEALNTKYGNSATAGREFLEKIIQLSLPLPPPSSQVLMTMLVDGIQRVLDSSEIKLDKIQEKRFTEYFEKAFRPQNVSPRQAKRCINGIAFALPILKGEVNPTDLIFLEAIKVFYPELYRVLRENGEEILLYTIGDQILGPKEELAEGIKQAIAEALKSIPQSSRSGIELLLQDLFPRLEQLRSLSSPRVAYMEADPVLQKRIATHDYFWRYFSYGIQPYDISDIEIDKFIEEIQNNDIEFVTHYIREYFPESRSRIGTVSRTGTVINKLRLREGELQGDTAIKLAKGLASLSDNFPPSDPFSFRYGFGTVPQIAALQMHLAISLKEEDRNGLLIDIAKTTPGITYSYQFAATMKDSFEYIRPTHKGWLVVRSGIERDVNLAVVNRIAEKAAESPIEDWDFAWASELYIFWFLNDAESLSSYLKGRLTKGIQSFLQSVAAFSGNHLTGTKEFSSDVITKLPLMSMLDCLIDLPEVVRRLETEKSGLDDRAAKAASQFVCAYREHKSRGST